jgi:hypothetical protein
MDLTDSRYGAIWAIRTNAAFLTCRVNMPALEVVLQMPSCAKKERQGDLAKETARSITKRVSPIIYRRWDASEPHVTHGSDGVLSLGVVRGLATTTQGALRRFGSSHLAMRRSSDWHKRPKRALFRIG